MRPLWPAILVAGLLLVSVGSAEEVALRGVLVWDSEHQTLTPCGSETVYWVRVLASNPHFLLSQRVGELTRQQSAGARIIAELEGTVSAVPSAGPRYPVDQALEVSRIRSVELGTCE